MRRTSLALGCLLVLVCGGAHAAKVKLSVPAGTFSARFLYVNERGVDVVSSSQAAKDASALDIPGDAKSDLALMVTDDDAGNAARIDLGRPPTDDVELRLSAEDFLWVETVEVRVTGQPDLRPVSGALVLIRRDGKPEFAWVSETTADGVARLGPVPSGNLSVDVWTTDRPPASQFVTIERERPGKTALIDVPVPAAGTSPGAGGPPASGATTPTPAESGASAAPLPMKVLVGLLGLVALVFFGKLWVFMQAQESAQAAPLAPTRADRAFGAALIGPAVVVALISGIASAISAGADGATPFLMAMLAQGGFALVAFVGVRGRNDALAGFGASALTAAFLSPLALAQTWASPADGTRLLAVILDIIGAAIALAILLAAVAALERAQAVPAAGAALREQPAPARAICPYCGEPIDEATGACACEAPTPAPAAPQPISGQPVLMGIRGKYAGVEFALREDGPTRLGRDAANDIVLDDPTVSRRHAQVERTEEGIVLSDLGSSNGTFVNGARIERAVLNPADEVTIGGSAFRLQMLG